MKNEIVTPAADAGTLTPEQRQVALESIYISTYAELRQFCFNEWSGLLVWDCDAVLERLPVFSYGGPLGTKSFTIWAQAHLAAEVHRIRFVTEAATEHRTAIRGAIWKAHRSWIEDHSYDTDDLHNEVLKLIWHMYDDLSQPGTAKLKTRLYGLARQHARNATKKRNDRHANVTQRANDFAECEIAATQLSSGESYTEHPS